MKLANGLVHDRPALLGAGPCRSTIRESDNRRIAMAVFLQLLLLVMGTTACSGADPPGGYYTTRYDHIEIESILNQKRLVKYYSLCLLDRGPCTPQGLEFKRKSVTLSPLRFRTQSFCCV